MPGVGAATLVSDAVLMVGHEVISGQLTLTGPAGEIFYVTTTSFEASVSKGKHNITEEMYLSTCHISGEHNHTLTSIYNIL